MARGRRSALRRGWRQRADVRPEAGADDAVYDAIAAIDLRRADAETRYYVERVLRTYRLNGVTLDGAARERVKQLNQDLSAVTREFLRNIQNNPGSVTVASGADLDGLPADFIARHAPDASGAITLSTNDSDYRPVLTFAKRDDVRKRLYVAQNNRAYPSTWRCWTACSHSARSWRTCSGSRHSPSTTSRRAWSAAPQRLGLHRSHRRGVERADGVTIKPAPNVAVWDPSVEAYEMLENGRMIARFYLDLATNKAPAG